MDFVNEYKNRGGSVTTGSDSGFIYKLYGFGYVRELELLREAGFFPLEVIRAATLSGARALGLDSDIGSVEIGKLADLVILAADPLEDIRNTNTLAYVVRSGELYDADTLDRIWPEPKPLPTQWWWQTEPPAR